MQLLVNNLLAILPTGTTLYQPQELLWLLIFSCFCGFLVSFGIGSNGLANSFATSIGSGALKFRYAIIIGSVMEFAGSLALGYEVASTIRGGIAKASCFVGQESILMLGMSSSLIGCGVWLLFATFLGLPVSTSHSIIGAIVGMVITTQGGRCVNWGITGFSGIVLSWVLSPILAGILCICVYTVVLKFVIKADDPESRAYKSLPVIFGLTIFVFLALILLKSQITKNLQEWIQWVIILSATIVSIIVGQFGGIPLVKKLVTVFEKKKVKKLKKKLEKENKKKEESEECSDKDSVEEESINTKNIDDSSSNDGESSDTIIMDEEESTNTKNINDNSSNDGESSDTIIDLPNDDNNDKKLRIEKEEKGENIFLYFQVLAAAFDSFAHGSNDVANAVGPFATIYFLYMTGKSTGKEVVPIWVYVVGAVGIIIGLISFSKRVMNTTGKKITKINYSKGFSIELSSTLAVVLASRIGMPVSSTHCQIGAVSAVGQFSHWIRKTNLAPTVHEDDKTKGIKWVLFGKILSAWLLTVPITAILTSGIYGLLSHFLIK